MLKTHHTIATVALQPYLHRCCGSRGCRRPWQSCRHWACTQLHRCEKQKRGGRASGQLDQSLEAAQKAGYCTPAALFHEPGHTCLLFGLILMHLFRGLSSELIIPPSVRPSPILGEAQNICFCSILSEISENHLCILQYLATVALKTHDKVDTFFVKCSKHTIKWKLKSWMSIPPS